MNGTAFITRRQRCLAPFLAGPLLFAGQSALPLRSSAQTYAEIQHINECSQNVRARADALRLQQWELLVSKAREYVTYCRDRFGEEGEANALEDIGTGLSSQGKFKDALPALKRCTTVEPERTSCFAMLGYTLEGLGRPAEARRAYEHAIDLGGYDDVSASALAMARSRLGRLPPDNQPQQPESKGPTRTMKFGTGFFVSPEGQLLTNSHVINGCTSLTTSAGVSLSIISENRAADLALLGSNTKPYSFARFGESESLRVGTAVMAFGFPFPGLLTPEGNSTTGTISAVSGPNGDLNLIQITAPIQPGNSGGPLVDQRATVIGVLVAKLDAVKIAEATGDIPQNVNFAVRQGVVTAFLDSLGIRYRKGHSAPTLSWPDVARQQKDISVPITCTE